MKFKSAILFATLLFGLGVPNAYADDCDLLCQVGRWFDDLGNDIAGVASDVNKMTKTVVPKEKDLTDFFEEAGIDITKGLDSAKCAELFDDIQGFDASNPTTNDFTNARLTVGIPLEFIKDSAPDDTFNAVGHTAALLPYYAYLWCEATLERDMINADTNVRDGFHQAILDNQAEIMANQERIEVRLDALDSMIDARFSKIEAILNTPSGKRSDWNK